MYLFLIKYSITKSIKKVHLTTTETFNKQTEAIVRSMHEFQRVQSETEQEQKNIFEEQMKSIKSMMDQNTSFLKNVQHQELSKKDEEIGRHLQKIKQLQSTITDDNRIIKNLNSEIWKRVALITTIGDQIAQNTVREQTQNLRELKIEKNKEIARTIQSDMDNLNSKLDGKDKRITDLEKQLEVNEAKVKVLMRAQEVERERVKGSGWSVLKPSQQQLSWEYRIAQNTHLEKRVKELEILLDKRNGEIHTLKTELNKEERNCKILTQSLNTTERERDHLATLLDTAEHYLQASDSGNSMTCSESDSELNSATTHKSNSWLFYQYRK